MEGSTQELRHLLSQPPPNWQPPPGPPPNPITILHASLEHIRNTGDEQYLFLRTLLEVLSGHGFFPTKSSTTGRPLSMEEEQLIFHCATGLRHVVLFRWESYQPSFRSCVRDLLLAIGLGLNITTNTANSHHLPRTITMACLSCASSFWKRGWTQTQNGKEDTSSHHNGDSQQSFLESLITNTLYPGLQRFQLQGSETDEAQELFFYLNSLLASPFDSTTTQQQQQSQNQQVVLQQRQYTAAMSASFLSLLVGEFTGGNSSARYNLPVEFHRLCHHLFESGSDDGAVCVNSKKSGLDATLNLSMTALSSLVGYILNVSNNANAIHDESLLELGSCIIDVTCDVLSWEFGAGASKWNFSSGTSSRKNNNTLLLEP